MSTQQTEKQRLDTIKARADTLHNRLGAARAQAWLWLVGWDRAYHAEKFQLTHRKNSVTDLAPKAGNPEDKSGSTKI